MCQELKRECLTGLSSMHANRFVCLNKHCIDISLKCNGVDDCGDGSDEMNCFRSSANNTFQPHNCPFGLCSQGCVVKKTYEHHNHSSSPQHYMCQCAEGYSRIPVVDSANHTTGIAQLGSCQANGNQAILLVSSDTGFRVVNPYKNSVQELQNLFKSKTNSLFPLNRTFISRIESFDVFYSKNVSHIFWTNPHQKTLYRVDITHIDQLFNLDHDLKQRKLQPKISDPIVVVANIENCKGVSVDWISRHVYWIDSAIPSIMLSTFDGRRTKTILSAHPLEQPYDLIVDPKNCFLFWTDWSHTSIKIGRANLDGSSWRNLVKNDVEWPLGLALDFEAGRLYWCDPKTSIIETIRIDGTDRRRVYALHRSQHKTHRLDVWEDSLFVSTFPNHQVLRLDKFGNNRAMSLVTGIVKLTDLVIIQEHKQKSNLTNPCRKQACHSSFLCIARTPETSTCVCPDGYKKIVTVKSESECVPTPPPIPDSNQQPTVDRCPCQNGGRCRYSFDDSLFCECTPLYDGKLCEHFRCSGHCKNHGLCYVDLSNVSSVYPTVNVTNTLGRMRCMCLFGWSGERCELPVHSCATGYCLNNGSCIEKSAGGIECECAKGFEGQQCEDCHKMYCKNSGQCEQTTDGQWRCKCLPGIAFFLFRFFVAYLCSRFRWPVL